MIVKVKIGAKIKVKTGLRLSIKNQGQVKVRSRVKAIMVHIRSDVMVGV